MKVFRSKDGKLRIAAGNSKGGQYAPDMPKNTNHEELLTQHSPIMVHNSLGYTVEDLFTAAKNGQIYKQTHPTLPYTIFKYTQNTVYQKHWNPITLTSRGLIVNHDTGELVARPFKKFFNHNEPSLDSKKLKGEHIIYEKLDGSLGISYFTPAGELNISTMGSFTSEQAIKATHIYNTKHAHTWTPQPHITYLWEIIYPDNQIVVNYGDKEDIILLGGVNKHTGETLTPERLTEWKGEKVTTHTNYSFTKLHTLPSRDNSEGFVVFFPKTNTHVKIKHEEYVTLHRLRTGLNETKIWEMLKTNPQEANNYYSTMPEEFQTFYNTTKNNYITQYNNTVTTIHTLYDTIINTLPPHFTRKTYAQHILGNPEYKKHAQTLFHHHDNPIPHYNDNTPPNQNIWKTLKPQPKP